MLGCGGGKFGFSAVRGWNKCMYVEILFDRVESETKSERFKIVSPVRGRSGGGGVKKEMWNVQFE